MEDTKTESKAYEIDIQKHEKQIDQECVSRRRLGHNLTYDEDL